MSIRPLVNGHCPLGRSLREWSVFVSPTEQTDEVLVLIRIEFDVIHHASVVYKCVIVMKDGPVIPYAAGEVVGMVKVVTGEGFHGKVAVSVHEVPNHQVVVLFGLGCEIEIWLGRVS